MQMSQSINGMQINYANLWAFRWGTVKNLKSLTQVIWYSFWSQLIKMVINHLSCYTQTFDYLENQISDKHLMRVRVGIIETYDQNQ
jgi:hypothetical protein